MSSRELNGCQTLQRDARDGSPRVSWEALPPLQEGMGDQNL